MEIKSKWNSASNLKRSIYISVLGIILWFCYNIIGLFSIIFKNSSGIYECSMSIHNPCSLLEYIFKSDTAVLFYISLVLLFLILLFISNLGFYLISLFKENRKKFWIIFLIIIFLIVLLPFIINYLQRIM